MNSNSSISQMTKSFLLKVVEMVILFIGFKFNEKNVTNVIDAIIEIAQVLLFFATFILLICNNEHVVETTKEQFKGCQGMSRKILIKGLFKMSSLYVAIGVCIYLAYYMNYNFIAVLLSINLIIRVALLILWMPYIFGSNDKEDDNDVPEKGSEYL